MRVQKAFFLSLVAALLFVAGNASTAVENTTEYRLWVETMKTAERGPFSRIRWFCADGSVLPPKAYACGSRGGGVQHGEWSDKTKTLRAEGYYIANTLAGLDHKDAQSWLAEQNFVDQYNQLLLEKFLLNVDSGWILRQAQFYRGAIQEEDERKGARELLHALLANEEWYTSRYAAARIGARLLAHGEDTASAQKVRQLAASLSDQDKGFLKIRSKIHGAPDANDSALVRDYASTSGRADLQQSYEKLAIEIDEVFSGRPLAEQIRAAATAMSKGPWLQKMLRGYADQLDTKPDQVDQYLTSSMLLAELRNTMSKIKSPGARLAMIDLSLVVEAENFRGATVVLQRLPGASRQQRLQWMGAAISAAYGTGLINPRLRGEVATVLQGNTDSTSLETYLDKLNYLGRAPGWATQSLRYQFFDSMQKLAEIEPLAMHFIQDQLRGSPLLVYSRILNGLSKDANRIAGVKHKVFGETIGSGFQALNPGLARGRLYTNANLEDFDNFDSSGIYVLPETISDLPPLSGIITAGEGNPLSHVQLLARNLGIPNITVDESLLPMLRKHEGKMVVLAVSPSGLVEINADSPKWQKMFTENQSQNIIIRPDLEKLDLTMREFVDLDDLRSTDSGRIVGPKAAQLGELRSHFPKMVAPGLGIPFGIFRQTVLEKNYKTTDKTVYDWMVEEYGKIRKMEDGSKARRDYSEAFRAELYELIINAPLDQQFQAGLRKAMEKAFGDLDGVGVFVRSDTNVEDLPGFTGAGLNLTLPNVTGFDNVVKSINRVWASPFTQRAFAWRQSHMDQPQYVYPAVLLLKSVANEKSGVMVTEDINTGDRNTISVAVNEGVGGAVDGQSAESLRINRQTGEVKVLATATAPWRRMPSAAGSIVKLPTSGSWTVLQPNEIKQMIAFAEVLPQRFPAITDDEGNPAPADVEFGFLDGKMQLFQLRPFLQSRKAQNNAYLVSMDKSLKGFMNRKVNLNEVPQ